ncbi:MAG: glyoxalase superfamily protein [Pseudomonadota bacterium]
MSLMEMKSATPVFRIFDVDKAREFYIEYLGFDVLFEHRFGDSFPLYIGLQHGGLQLHLSEHHGDATPGSAVRIEVSDIKSLHHELAARDYRFAKPGLEAQPWGCQEVALVDPFGNRLIFFQYDDTQ